MADTPTRDETPPGSGGGSANKASELSNDLRKLQDHVESLDAHLLQDNILKVQCFPGGYPGGSTLGDSLPSLPLSAAARASVPDHGEAADSGQQGTGKCIQQQWVSASYRAAAAAAATSPAEGGEA